MKATVKIFFLTVLSFLCAIPVYSQENQPVNPGGSGNELEAEIRWLEAESVVFTASKREQSIFHAPSVMTVYTAEDIKRQGLRSVKEVIERTAGFFSTITPSNPIIGSRGIVAGENEPYLLLIDGNNMNSIVEKGPGDYDRFPLISQVKRIEIVRGPGSTLWGSDAALGIIHIITKDGEDIDGLQTTIDYASEDDYRYTNLLYGKKTGENRDVMLSYTYAESHGYPKEDYYPSDNRSWIPNPLPPIEKTNDSWELYGKMREGHYTMTCSASDLMDIRLQSSSQQQDDLYNRRRQYTFSFGHSKELGSGFSMESKVFSSLIEQWQEMANPLISDGIDYVSESLSSKESNLGIEATVTKALFSNHQLLSGIQIVRTEVDPVMEILKLPLEGNTSVQLTQNSVKVAPDAEDLNMAAYVEDNWRLRENLSVRLGIRIDDNNLRENSTILLPRFGTIWDINKKWTAKYLYNTGYVRPPVAKGFLDQAPWSEAYGVYLYGVTDSEEVDTHDLQLIFHNQTFTATLTGYHVIFDNRFSFLPDHAMGNYILYYVNDKEITSDGIEFDFQHKMNPSMDWYGNVSQVIRSKIDGLDGASHGIAYDYDNMYVYTDDRTLTQFPHQIWNLGINFLAAHPAFSKDISLNLHYRGWSGLWGQVFTQTWPTPYKKYGPEHFIDMNMVFSDFLIRFLDISVYCKNLLNNDDAEIPLWFMGHYPERGQSIGVKMIYKF